MDVNFFENPFDDQRVVVKMVNSGARPINLLFYAFSMVAFEKNLIFWTLHQIHGINPLKIKQTRPNWAR